jgi:TPR repeat protein
VQELLLARHFLDGKGGTRDTAEAVKWLWKAVGKQNTGAVILLADLYLIGDGVPKNCDQARLLLVAAAKRGASDAAQKLRSLESNGCS